MVFDLLFSVEKHSASRNGGPSRISASPTCPSSIPGLPGQEEYADRATRAIHLNGVPPILPLLLYFIVPRRVLVEFEIVSRKSSRHSMLIPLVMSSRRKINNTFYH
jgi:hypothetical protein